MLFKNGIFINYKRKKMKKLLLITFSLFLSLISLNNVHAQIVNKNDVFLVGEKFVLDAYFNLGLLWFKVGTAEFKVETENDNYKFVVTAKSLPKWDWLYSVNTLHVASCTKDMKPLYMWSKVHENGEYSEDSYTFEDKGGYNSIHRVKKSNKIPGGVLDTVFNMQYEAHDIINSVYVARNADLTFNGGKKIPFYPIFGNKIFTIYGDVLGEETVKTKEGEKYDCLKCVAHIGGGTIADKDVPIYVYVTKKEKVPVLVEAKLSFGSVRVYLNELKVEGNK